MDLFLPLQILADKLVYGALGIAADSHLGSSLNFFVYDALKIFVLLIAINYLMAVVRHHLPVERLRGFLASRKWYGLDHLLAALFGAVTPFCSCSSIPLFMGFVGAGIPLGVTLSFLITSPLVNVASVAVLAGILGWKVAAVYVSACIVLGVVGGALLGSLRFESHIADRVLNLKIASSAAVARKKEPFGRLARSFWKEGWGITAKIMPYVLLGVGVGAAIHGYVPAGYFERHISAENLLAVPLAVILGVPLYANSIGVIPVIEPIIAKGVPLGTALAFMMATVGLSLPEALILKRVMKMRLLLAFFGLTALNIMAVGYLLNMVF